MRQPQHRNRARMRARRQPNPVNKVYESNGPDVKVRGTPQQIVDKYMQLGRDALASGDAVKAENYFQHAEHYLRIITAAQEQMQARRQQQEQRRQEAAERRKGNGSAQAETDAAEAVETAVDPASQPQPEVAEVVVLPTEANAGQAAADEGDAADTASQEAPAWDGEPPSFLARSVSAEDSGESSTEEAGKEIAEGVESAEEAAGEEGAATRKTTRRRRTTRTTRARKGNGDAKKVAEDPAEAAGEQPPAADNA